MTNTLCVLLYSPFIVATLILFADTLYRGRTSATFLFGRRLCLYGLLILVQATCVLTFFLSTPFLLMLAFSVRAALYALLTLVTFFLILDFFGLGQSLPKAVRYLFCAVPVATVVIAATNAYHGLYISDLAVLSLEPLLRVATGYGVWRYVYLIYSAAINVFALALVFAGRRRLAYADKVGAPFFVFTVLITAAGAALNSFAASGTIDFALFATASGGLLIYLAVIEKTRPEHQRIGRRDMFDALDEAVFIIDAAGIVVDQNEAAKKLFFKGRAPQRYISLSKFLDEQCFTGKLLRKKRMDGMGEDLYILGTNYPLVYHMRTELITDRNGALAGSYCILKDVTDARLHNERLNELAGVDLLTGLNNRHGQRDMLMEIDRHLNLPIGIILADINDLKLVNDTYGRQRGDQVIKAVSDTLKARCPEGGYVARVGRNEFVMVFPNSSLDGTDSLAVGIRKDLDRILDFPSAPSVALGVSAKVASDENINILISEAADRMYGALV